MNWENHWTVKRSVIRVEKWGMDDIEAKQR